jgi:serine/threonine-protein kinase HipA
LPAIAIERFDRDAAGLPLPLESWFSILASGARDINSHFDGSYERIARAIDMPSLTLVADRRAAKRHLYQRLVLALLTGNGDLHLGNLSVLGAADSARFSPVYDPTPMRAYSLHNLLCPIPFGDYGEYERDGEHIIGLGAALGNFARHLGIRPGEARALAAAMLHATTDYPERLDALATLPQEHKARLKGIAIKLQRAIRHYVDLP